MDSRAAIVDPTRRGGKAGAPGVLAATLLLCACGDILAPAAPVAFTDLAVGAFHACALDTDGQAWCWGRGDAGALGTGGRGDRDRATPVAADEGVRFTSITAAGNHTCALDDGGAAHCWGTAASVVPGDERLTPAPIAGAPPFAELSAGDTHACGRTAAGEIHCWGSADHGQLGRGDRTASAVPAAVAGTLAFISVSAGGRHACGIAEGGEGYCWGADDQGQLGDGPDHADRLVPTPITGGLRFGQLDAGYVNTCGLEGQTPWCWGAAEDGQPGDYIYFEGRPPDPEPIRVGGTLIEWSLTSIRAGHRVICAVNPGGRAQGLCWGNGEFGQIGNGRTGDQAGPHYLTLHPTHHHNEDALHFRFVDPSGVRHVCGLSVDGAVFCWGTGARGELGSEGAFAAFPQRVRQGG